ncbi:MAG: sulfur carrier protein ThiS [Gammaproteobacteria bacterium]|nr:sulfur carrier protein ThiS [Gammaproteobacteria bacterium]MDE2461361.1 sulfur carrier protein ThiS [Gammaproteobacteria bacterium]
MQIQLNGTPTDIPDALSARELLDRLELAGQRVALEVNGEIVPRSTHSGYRFHSDDKVEIVHAIGGG